jgi:UDP-N-acetylmuramate dehydrogenase
VDWPNAFADALRSPTPLSTRTSLGIGGVADWFFEPADAALAGEIYATCHARGVPVRVLGGGYNLLVADGRIEGAVLSTGRLRHERVLDDRVEVGAGNAFATLVGRAPDLGIPVISGCPGIPGSVGGIVSMNAGGRFGSAGEAVLEVEGYEANGKFFRRRVGPKDLGYRWTSFQGTLVTGVSFRRDPSLDASAARRLFAEAAAWKRATQPLTAASAGCFFKNPPAAPSAGARIDRAGLKGARVGGAVVSPVHANFLVNDGSATCADMLALVEHVQGRVREAQGVDLELEVAVWR